MKKKSNEGNGVLFPPELREVANRLKDKEAELDELLSRDPARDAGKPPINPKKKVRGRPLMTEAMRKEIVKIVRVELAAWSSEPRPPDLATIQLPPRPAGKIPGKSGRRVSPERREKIATNCDAELLRLFIEWSTKRGLALNRALDTALWHFLGKPPLSFETAEE